MPIFLSKEQIYRIIQRELPADAYPDGQPSRYYSTADSESQAKTMESAYANLARIYDNYFPAFSDERIDDWLITTYGIGNSYGSSSLDEKRQAVLAKLRKQSSINLWEVLTLVVSALPEGVFAQVHEYCEDPPDVEGWRLGVSQLGLDTTLGLGVAGTPLLSDYTGWCDYISNVHWRLGTDALGVNTTLADPLIGRRISLEQRKAYGYEIRIFDFTLSGQDFLILDNQVKATEPARSSHKWVQGVSLSSYGLTVPVANASQTSGVNCIARDQTQSTGYIGRKR